MNNAALSEREAATEDSSAWKIMPLTLFIAGVDILVVHLKRLSLRIPRNGRRLGKKKILFTVVGVLPT